MKNNTEVFLFVQLLRCVPSFVAEIWKGGGGGGGGSVIEAQNSPVQLGLSFPFCPTQNFYLHVFFLRKFDIYM